MGSKIFKSMMLLCCGIVIMYANPNTESEHKGWLDVKKYTTEPNFSNMPRNIVESYRFVWLEYDYTEYIRISKMIQKGKIFYQIDGAYDDDYNSYKEQRFRARITKKEWKKLRSNIEHILSYDYLGARDERRMYDIGTVATEIYRNGKNCYIERYDYVGNKDEDQLHDYFKMISQVYKFYYKNIVKNKHRDKQVYDLQKELDERKQAEKEKRQKKLEQERKRQKAIFDSKQLWDSATTGALGGIGYFKDMNANIINAKGQTPLMVAVKNGYVEVVRAMSEATVNVWAKDTLGKTAFDYIQMSNANKNALQNKHIYSALRVVEVSQIVKKKAKITQYDYHNDTDILNITIKGTKCGNFVFPKNTHCKSEKPPSNSDIFKAIKTKNNTFFDILLPTMENLSRRNKSKYTPLWASIHYENYYALEQLLDAGEDMYELDQFDLKTPVYWATMTNNTKLLKILLKHGADVNSKNVFGDVALSTAMYKCSNFDTVAILLENGANPYLKDKRGKNVFEKEPVFCKDKQNIAKMKQLLKEYSAYNPE